jgi:hypothetical protein
VRLVYLVTCDFALVSADGKPTLVGVFNAIRGAAAPLAWPRFSLAGRLEFDSTFLGGSHYIEIAVRDPSGAIVGHLNTTMPGGTPPPDTPRLTFDPQIVFDNFVFASFGTYSFSVSVDGTVLGTTQIDIIQQTA